MTRPTLIRLRRALVLAVLAGAMSGCYFTSRPARQVILASNYGQTARIRFRADIAAGELLALNDTALFLLRDNRVALAPLRAVRGIEFSQFTTYDVIDGVLQSKDRDEVQRRSRFPYGLTADALANLLRATGQTQPDVLTALFR